MKRFEGKVVIVVGAADKGNMGVLSKNRIDGDQAAARW